MTLFEDTHEIWQQLRLVKKTLVKHARIDRNQPYRQKEAIADSRASGTREQEKTWPRGQALGLGARGSGQRRRW